MSYIQDNEKHLEFAILLSIFLPTLIYILLQSSSNNLLDTGRITLGWYTPITFLISTYITLYLFKKYYEELFLKISNILLLVFVASYILPTIDIILELQNIPKPYNNPDWAYILSVKLSFYAIDFIPILIFTYLLVSGVICLLKHSKLMTK
jgi:hypothetical protein